MTLFSFIGVAVTSASFVIFGEGIWDPVALIGRFNQPVVALVALIALLIATLNTNVAANVVSPSNDFSNLNPRRISFRTGGLITGCVGIVMMPWKLIADPHGYIFTWLIAYSALLGAVGGILICDYFVLRRTHLNVKDLFNPAGRYTYVNGVNARAVAALVIAIAPCVPGFLHTVGVIKYVPPAWD